MRLVSHDAERIELDDLLAHFPSSTGGDLVEFPFDIDNDHLAGVRQKCRNHEAAALCHYPSNRLSTGAVRRTRCPRTHGSAP